MMANPLLIIWRCIWAVPIYITVFVLYIMLIVGGQGKNKADQFLKDF